MKLHVLVMLFALAVCYPAELTAQSATPGPTGTWARNTTHIEVFEDEGKSMRPWLDSLFTGVLNGSLTAYDMEGEQERVIGPEVIRAMLHHVDSMYTEDLTSGELTLYVVEGDLSAKDVSAIGFRERIFFLPGSGLAKSMDAYAPYVAVSDSEGNYRGLRPLFWIKPIPDGPRSR